MGQRPVCRHVPRPIAQRPLVRGVGLGDVYEREAAAAAEAAVEAFELRGCLGACFRATSEEGAKGRSGEGASQDDKRLVFCAGLRRQRCESDRCRGAGCRRRGGPPGGQKGDHWRKTGKIG